MQPFNLDRFKAGEPAYDKETHEEYFYVTELPDNNGRIVSRHNSWCPNHSLQFMNEWFYMIEKELTWDKVSNMWANDKIDRTVFFEWLDANFEAPKPKNK